MFSRAKRDFRLPEYCSSLLYNNPNISRVSPEAINHLITPCKRSNAKQIRP